MKLRQKERVPSRFDTRLWLYGLGRVQTRRLSNPTYEASCHETFQWALGGNHERNYCKKVVRSLLDR